MPKTIIWAYISLALSDKYFTFPPIPVKRHARPRHIYVSDIFIKYLFDKGALMKKQYVLAAMAFLLAALVILGACKHPTGSAEEAVSEEAVFEETASEETVSEEAVFEEAGFEKAVSEEDAFGETIPEETVPAQPVTRAITIDMYDSYGDGWGGNGALRITVNGIEIANNVRVSTLGTANTPIGQGKANTYTFTAVAGDVVQLYWVTGTNQGENSFIVYYAGTPPIPAFTVSNNNNWIGTNALVYRLRGTMNSISDGTTLLGSFTVAGNTGG